MWSWCVPEVLPASVSVSDLLASESFFVEFRWFVRWIIAFRIYVRDNPHGCGCSGGYQRCGGNQHYNNNDSQYTDYASYPPDYENQASDSGDTGNPDLYVNDSSHQGHYDLHFLALPHDSYDQRQQDNSRAMRATPRSRSQNQESQEEAYYNDDMTGQKRRSVVGGAAAAAAAWLRWLAASSGRDAMLCYARPGG